MFDELRKRAVSYLSQSRVCVIAVNGTGSVWAASTQYESSGLEIICRLPRWSDTLFYIESNPQVMVIILSENPMLWMQYRGSAQIVNSAGDQFVEVHITPQRIDLIDESRGWGVRETLDL